MGKLADVAISPESKIDTCAHADSLEVKAGQHVLHTQCCTELNLSDGKEDAAFTSVSRTLSVLKNLKEKLKTGFKQAKL